MSGHGFAHRCETCRWWDEAESDIGRCGHCLRHPPVWVGPSPAEVNEDEYFEWLTTVHGWRHPVTGMCSSCGEWAERDMPEVQTDEDTATAKEVDVLECIRIDAGGRGQSVTVHSMECTVCGATFEHTAGMYRMCPHCGRRFE